MVLLKIGLCGFLAFVREIVKVGGKVHNGRAASSIDDLIGGKIFGVVSGRYLYGIAGIIT